MRLQKIVWIVVTMSMALLTVTGTALTDRFPQAAHAESVGFDALAHDLFDGALLADEEPEQKQ